MRGQRYKPTNPKTNLGAFTGKVFGQDPQAVSCDCFTRVGQPMVDSDASTYVEYNARQGTSNVTTSAILSLLKIAQDGTTASVTQLTSTSSGNDGEMWPSTIIPDGQGGVLATWIVGPSSGSGVQGPNPYRAAHVTPDGGLTPYVLPMAPTQVETNNNGLPIDLPLVLGENGVAFISYGPNVVSFNLNSGAVNWNYQAAAQSGLSIIASASGNGLVAKNTASGIDTVVRVDATGSATTDTWSANAIDYLFGNLWTGETVGIGIVEYAALGPQEASAPGTRPNGDPQHNGTTDPGMVLVATQDCHKTNSATPPLYARYPIYKLRLPSDKSKTPQQKYTVFEFIPRNPTKCGVGGYLSLNPCEYGDGSPRFPNNEFDDEITTGITGGAFSNTQYFLYGLPNQRLFGVKQIFRTLPDGSLQPKVGWNQLSAIPFQDPLIDGQLDPWLAPWDGKPASCNSSFSIYFP